MKHIINCLVENQPGVLARIVGLISGRGYNIETLNVGPTADATVSKMTIVVPGDSHIVPVYAGANSRAVAMAAALRKRGFLALPVRPPTVPENTARLRISLRATLRWEDVSGVLDALGEVA